jgi:hypothetical protein
MRISDWGFRIENNKISIKTESEFRNPCPPSLSPLRHRLRLKAIAGRAHSFTLWNLVFGGSAERNSTGLAHNRVGSLLIVVEND